MFSEFRKLSFFKNANFGNLLAAEKISNLEEKINKLFDKKYKKKWFI